jgi:hypothetical protein
MNNNNSKLIDMVRVARGFVVRNILKPKSSYFLFREPKRNVDPISIVYGFDRGYPLDRYYIDSFMEDNKDAIKGKVLEVTDRRYTKQFGGDKVTQSDALDINVNNKEANIYGDLRDVKEIESNTYDCFIVTQTYVMIDDYEAAIRESFRILKPGGTLLVTMPCLSPCWNLKNHHWRFTGASSEYIFGKYVKPENLEVKTYGNALAGQAFWVGMSQQDLTKEELDYNDPFFPIVVTIKAIKDKS